MTTSNVLGIAMPGRKLLLAAFVFFSIQIHAADISTGEWVGGSDLFESPVFMHLEISSLNNERKAVANVPQWRMVKRPLLNLKLNGEDIYFEIASTTGVPFIAEGKLANGVIEGTISRGDKKGKFHLILIKPVSRDLLTKYTGCYQLPDPAKKGVLLPFLVLYSSNGHLRLVNLVDGGTTPLLPLTNNKFFFAGSIVTNPVPSSTLTFELDNKGNVEKFSIQLPGLAEQFGKKAGGYKIEEVQAVSKNHSLAGNLILPDTKKKHPVFVIVHGSQAIDRDNTTPYEEIRSFISNGFGLLIFDKQGTGQSGGDWQKASYEDLADDVLAFVKLLKSRRDIDPARIGLWGFSQGGSIAPIAASRSKDVSFLIIQSGGGITPAEAEMNQQVVAMQTQKFSDTLINEAIAFMQLQFKAVNVLQAWDSLQAINPIAKTKPWYKHTWGGLPREHWIWNWWKPVVGHNPVPVLEKIKIPVLVIFGTHDQYVPKDSIDVMIARIKSGLDRAGNKSVTVVKFQNANHEIFVKNEKNEFRLAEGYDETLQNFLRKIKALDK